MATWTALTFAFFVNMLIHGILASRGNKFANSEAGLMITGLSVVGFYVCGSVMILMFLYQTLFQ